MSWTRWALSTRPATFSTPNMPAGHCCAPPGRPRTSWAPAGSGRWRRSERSGPGAAGLPQDKLIASGVGPVALETTIKFRRELRGGDEVDVSCVFSYGTGKTFTVTQQITKLDGTVAAEITGTAGMLDLAERRLIA